VADRKRGHHPRPATLAHRLDRGPDGSHVGPGWTAPRSSGVNLSRLAEEASQAASSDADESMGAAPPPPHGPGVSSAPARRATGGRPPLPPEARRTHRVHLSLSEDGQAKLFGQAEQARQRPATFGRQLLLERLAAHRLRPTLLEDDLEGLRARTAELNRAVRRLHLLDKDQPAPVSVEDIATEVADLLGPLGRHLQAARELLQARGHEVAG